MLKSRNKRSANFVSEEVALLIDLISKYKSIIECKQPLAGITRKKLSVWETIEKEFNCRSGIIYRDAGTLKMKYENIKKTNKKNYVREKSLQDVPLTKAENSCDIPVIIFHDNKSEVRNIQDALIIKTDQDECIEQNNDDSVDINGESLESTFTDPIVQKPLPLHTVPEQRSVLEHRNIISESSSPKRNSCFPRTDKNLLDDWSLPTEAKLELVQLQKTHLEEAHLLQLKMLKEQHNLKIKHMQEEHKLKIEIMQRYSK